MKEKVLSRLLKYVSIDTESDPENEGMCPSAEKEFDLANMLVDELKAMGLEDAKVDENCYVTAKLPANAQGISPIGFIAHMDTSPAISGKNVKPRVIENYDGKDIILNEEKNIVTSLKDYPEIVAFKGETIVVTDGNTLLGADDKAGIAEIMTGIEYLIEHPEIKHGDVMIGFTPDEEIGTGADLFDVEKFGAKYAYTFDGAEIGELQYENFNAATAVVKIQGRNVHPGTAKNKMVNACYISGEVMEAFPLSERPETTEGYEGFYHLDKINGSVEEVEMEYIIRDHDMDKFNAKKEFFKKNIELLSEKHDGRISVKITDSYYNMKEIVEKNMVVVDIAVKSMKEVGITPKIIPIRGGTDGARLSFMGLPCPNIFTGGINFHGRNEMVSVDAMEKAAELLVKIVENYALEEI